MNLERSASNQAIVRTTIELGHNLGLKVVAEGIETPDVWAALLRMGCDLAQGYFIDTPKPAHELGFLARAKRPAAASPAAPAPAPDPDPDPHSDPDHVHDRPLLLPTPSTGGRDEPRRHAARGPH